jgi:hypothetical protein
MSSETSRSTPEVSLSALAAAAERRVSGTTQQKTTAEIAAEYEKRQKFRRMIDPGITRPNAEAQAHRSLKVIGPRYSTTIECITPAAPQTLLKIAQNLIREPDNGKYQKIKSTNLTVKSDLMDPKGTVEYLREVSFFPYPF